MKEKTVPSRILFQVRGRVSPLVLGAQSPWPGRARTESPWGAGPLGGCHGLAHSPAMAGREHSAGRDPQTVRAGQLLGRWELDIQGWAPSSAAPARGFGADRAAATWVQLGEPPWRGL